MSERATHAIRQSPLAVQSVLIGTTAIDTRRMQDDAGIAAKRRTSERRRWHSVEAIQGHILRQRACERRRERIADGDALGSRNTLAASIGGRPGIHNNKCAALAFRASLVEHNRDRTLAARVRRHSVTGNGFVAGDIEISRNTMQHRWLVVDNEHVEVC